MVRRSLFQNKLLYKYEDSKFDKFNRLRWHSVIGVYELSYFNLILHTIMNLKRVDSSLWKQTVGQVHIYLEDPMDQQQVYLTSKQTL